jgi:hypothetical protein
MDLIDLSIKLNLNVNSDDLTSLADNAYELTFDAQERYLGFKDCEIHVWVEQGTVSYKTKVIIGLVTLYNVISGIDGFVGGLEKVYNYSNQAINYLSTKLVEPNPSKVIESKRSAGATEKIKKILSDLQQGKYSVDVATGKVEKLIDAEEANDHLKEQFIDLFSSAAKASYKSSDIQLYMFPQEEPLTKKPVPRKPVRRRPLSEPSLQGVEIWYDVKTGRKQIRKYRK